jgi:UDP-N-acetylmuramoyl-L-alanine---L-glutamate ligase
MTGKIKTLGIVGFGKEGQAVFQHYKNQFDQIYIFDEILKNLEGVDSNVKLFNTFNIPSQVDFLVKSPGISTHKVQLQNPSLEIQSLISILFEKLDMSKVIAVTGTKGKSTVSSLIFHILKNSGKIVELLGNIGNINIDLLSDFDPETYYVFELSSFQCQQLTCSPHITVWTNFFIDHQDVHKDMEEYYEAKANICRFQNYQDYFITIPELANVETKGKKIIVGLDPQNLPKSLPFGTGSLAPLKMAALLSTKLFQTKLLGQHNQINCQFAFEACKLIGINEDQILEAISTFQPIKGRLEKVNEIIKNGKLIEFYTDDLATIPEATWQAVLAFEGRVETLITGGYDKGSKYTEFAKNLVDSKIQNLIYFNPTGQLIVSKLDPKKVNLVEAKSMKEAVNLAFKLTNKGICLLSCASASFGMFKNAYDRGEQYRDYITQAKNK